MRGVGGGADRDYAVVGAGFDTNTVRVGDESLESWLLRPLEPELDFRLFQVSIEGQSVIVLEIERAFRQPVQFRGQEYIRVAPTRRS